MKVARIEIRKTFKPSRLINPPAEYSWHVIGMNGRKLGWTGETYKRRAHCINALIAIIDPFARAIPVFEVNGKKKTPIEFRDI